MRCASVGTFGMKRKSAHVIAPASLSKLKRYPITARTNLVNVRDFAGLVDPDCPFGEFIRSLPRIYAGNELRNLARSIAKAHLEGKMVGAALGGHVVKCGLSPIIIDLMKRGIIHLVAMHGATAIHDYEISLIGETSEDVSTALDDGSFGMCRETPRFFARASIWAIKRKQGLGCAAGELIRKERNTHRDTSILAAGAHFHVPVTVHLAFGTDTIFMHPETSGAKLGEATHADFKLLCGFVCGLESGVWLNIGSAVIMPEVFLKAFNVARNLGHGLKNVTTANLDMLRHYRPEVNVLGRPAAKSFNLTCHHEIMLPLLRAAILSELKCLATSSK